MSKLIIELTNRCNLKCHHCWTGRHGGNDDLPLEILERLLAEAKDFGFDHVSFTGGDPTVYRHFPDALRLTAEAGYEFGFVTNGRNFVDTHHHLLPYRERLRIITFSVEGATEATHDRLRGKGSFRRVLQAISICVMKGIPFSISMVVTANNRHEIQAMAELAPRLGSRGLRFGHLMPTPITTEMGFDLTPWERKTAEAEIWELRYTSPIPIAMGPGYHTTDLFPCSPLQMREVNVDCYGNVTKCCQLSGHGNEAEEADIMGNLAGASFGELYGRLTAENQQFHQAKKAHLAAGDFKDTDFFPCWYCTLHYKKVDWLTQVEGHVWGALINS